MKKTKSPKEKILGVKVRVLDDLIKEKKKSFAGFFFCFFFVYVSINNWTNIGLST
jgi:hypothetical protein